MKKRNDKSKVYSSVFWACIRTGGIGIASAIGGIVFLFIEKIPTYVIILTGIVVSAITLAPFILSLAGVRAEPFDETVQKNRHEALSAAANFFLETLFAFAIIVEVCEINISTGAMLMFAAAWLCVLQCLLFWALESRSKQDAKAYNEDDVAGDENAF